MKKKGKDMNFFDLIEEIVQTDVARIVDPSTLDHDERHLFIDTIYVDYLYHKDKKNYFLTKYVTCSQKNIDLLTKKSI